MQPDEATVATAAETPTDVIESPVDKPTDVIDAPKADVTPVADETAKALEEARKERDKAIMRANQLENERKAAEQRQMEEAGKYKELYEQQQAEIEERQAREDAEAARKANLDLRNKAISEFENETVRKAAEKLISKNPNSLFWTVPEGQDGISEEEAYAQVKQQLEAIAEVVAPEATDENKPPISGNNGLDNEVKPSQTTDEEMKELEKKLADFKF